MTLIEILVVLVLIGIVLGIVGGNFIGKGEKAKADAAKIEIGQIAQTLDLYKLEIGRYPTTQEGLQALDRARRRRHQLERPVLEEIDGAEGPVGQRIQVHVAGARTAPYDIISLGADGKEGGEGAEQGHHELRSNDRVACRSRRPACASRAAISRARGVTLLELLIVLVDHGIVAAIVDADRSAAACRRAELRRGARRSPPGLRLARSEALAQRRETLLVLDLAGTRVQGRPRSARSTRCRAASSSSSSPRRAISSATRSASIRFFPDGGSNGGRITLAAGERKYDVDVDWLTGRVAILD